MIKQIAEEFKVIEQELQAERKAREMEEEHLLELLKDVIQKVRQQIASERLDRERTEETFVNLLEATCNKLNLASDDI